MWASIGAGTAMPVYLALVGNRVAALSWGTAFLKGARCPDFRPPFMPLPWSQAGHRPSPVWLAAWGVLKLPVSVVAPLTNSNALVAVLIKAVAFPNGVT